MASVPTSPCSQSCSVADGLSRKTLDQGDHAPHAPRFDWCFGDVPPGRTLQTLGIGRQSLVERLVDPLDYGNGVLYTLRPGERFVLALGR